MTTGFSVGDAVGRVIIDASGVRAGINEAKRSIGNGFRDIGSGVSQIGGAITMLTAPLMAFGAVGVRSAGDFDAAIRELSARTGIVGADLERMKQAAIDAGAATVFSASDAANSLLQLTSSGLTAEEALAVLPAVMDGAAAAGTGLGDTADWITDIMAAFGLEADQAGYVIDSLVRAAGSGSATVGDLAMGFQNAGGIASMFGLSVDETAAALQIFSENGIKGAEAGTQLKSMLNNMTRNTAEVTGVWENLGISMYDVAGNARPLNDVIQDLNTRLNDGSFTQEEQIDIIKTLGGSYGQLGLQALLTSDGLDGMTGSMANAADAATVAESKMGGWRGMLENLSGSLETFQINVLTPFMNDHLVPLGNKISDVVNWLSEWSTANPGVSGSIVMIIAALGVLGPVMLITGNLITQTAAAFEGFKLVAKGLSIMLGAISWPVALLIVAVAALAAAWYTNFGGIRDKVAEVVEYVKPKLTEIFDALKNADVAGAVAVVETMAADVQTKVTEAWPTIQAEIEKWAAAFVEWAGPAAESLLAALPGIINSVTGFIETQAPIVVEKLASWAAAFVDWIEPQIVPMLGALGGLATRFWDWLTQKANSLALKLGTWGAEFVNWIAPAAESLLLSLPSIMATITTWILDVTPDIAAKLLLFAVEFVKWVGPAAAALITRLGGVLSDILEWILGELIPAFIAEAPGIAEAFLEFVAETATKVIPALAELLTTIEDEITNTIIPAVRDAALDVGQGIVDGIEQGINDSWDAMIEWVSEKASELVDMFKIDLKIWSPSRVFRDEIGKNIVAGLAAGLADFGPVETSMKHLIAATTPDALTRPAGLMPTAAPAGGGRQVMINVTVTPDMIRNPDVIEANADLFGQQLAARLAAQG